MRLWAIASTTAVLWLYSKYSWVLLIEEACRCPLKPENWRMQQPSWSWPHKLGRTAEEAQRPSGNRSVTGLFPALSRDHVTCPWTRHWPPDRPRWRSVCERVRSSALCAATSATSAWMRVRFWERGNVMRRFVEVWTARNRSTPFI